MKSIIIDNLTALNRAASQIIKQFGDHRVIAFYGEMGAGKTTIIREICHQMHVTEQVNSPTFALINVYHTLEKDEIYHFDFYRISKIEEVYDLGYEEYLFSGNYCFIEWPELIEHLLPENTLRLEIVVTGDESREVRFLPLPKSSTL